MLPSRVADLPQLVIALCHVLSGGLPRDLIRAVRSLINLFAQGSSGHITRLCEAMVAVEVETLKGACLSTMAAEPDQLEESGLLPKLLDRSWPGESAEDMLRTLDHDLRKPEIPRNFCAALYFYATVAEVFGPALTATTDALRARGESADSGISVSTTDHTRIDKLAQARNSLSGNPDIAWELLNRFRMAAELTQLTRPWQSSQGIPASK